MVRQGCRWAAAACAAGVLGTILAGCGNDASADAFVPNRTPTGAAQRQVTTPAPTPTAIPADS